MAQPPKVLLICGDLFFASRVTGAAEGVGVAIDVAARLEQVRERLRESDYGLVLLDLEMRGVTPAEVIGMLPEDGRPHIVAFGPHVREEQLRAAREAGCDEVFARGRFSNQLADILKRAFPG